MSSSRPISIKCDGCGAIYPGDWRSVDAARKAAVAAGWAHWCLKSSQPQRRDWCPTCAPQNRPT